MKAYIIQIIGGALLAVFADIFSPAEWKKYIGVITGIILITIIITPLAKLKNTNVLSSYRSFDTETQVRGEEIYSDMLKKEFSENLALDIKERVKDEFSKEVSVEVSVEMNEKGGIKKITKIVLHGIEPNKEICGRISYIYNVDEVVCDVG